MFSWIEARYVYPIPPVTVGNWNPPWQYRDVEIPTRDRLQLHGWLLEHPCPRHWICYFHGNSSHVALAAQRLAILRPLLCATILVFDYRGYGRSQGRPTEAGLLADGEAAAAWLARESQRDVRQLVFMGRSLGGAVAIGVAARMAPQVLIVERTFTRLSDVASRRFPLVPVRFFMRNQFPAIDWIADFHGPLLLSHGTRDTLVPFEQGQMLFQRHTGSVKEFVVLEGCGHDDPDPLDYPSRVLRFLEQVPKISP